VIFVCPRCRKGQMDSDAGEKASCWHCSQWVPCYVCRGDDPCGAKLCAACVTKIQAGQKPKFVPGSEEVEGG